MQRAWLLLALPVLLLFQVGCPKKSEGRSDPPDREKDDAGRTEPPTKGRGVVDPLRDASTVDANDGATSSFWNDANDYLLEVGTLGPKRSPCSEGEFSVFYEPHLHQVATLVCEEVDGEWIVVDHDGPTEEAEDALLAAALGAAKTSPKIRCDATKPDAVLTVSGGDAGARTYGDAEGRCNVPGVSLYLTNMANVVSAFRALTLPMP